MTLPTRALTGQQVISCLKPGKIRLLALKIALHSGDRLGHLRGRRAGFGEPTIMRWRLDLGEQDPFFERIYAVARRVAWGHTTTYGALANQLGAGPEAARDVGQAIVRNPAALIIPCHRVLAASGKVGGFSAPGGSAAKIRMLELERIHVEPPRPTQRSFAF